jgi:1-acyl-sn-glycerol-3-phosphate acyltransferase
MNISNTKSLNKELNSMCFCGIALMYLKKEIIMLNPCEHMVHKCCYAIKNYTSCPICNESVISITRGGDYKKDIKLYQKCVDILSMTNFDTKMKICYDSAVFNIPRLIGIGLRIPFTKGFESGRALCGDILRLANVKITVKGLDKIKEGPKIFISNHTCYLDFFILFYILKTGFLAASGIVENPLTKPIANVVPIMIVKLGGGKANTVKKMIQYVEKKGSICLFPEGMLSHPNTLCKFRSGAFNTGHIIYPIVLKYKNNMADTSFLDFTLKLGSETQEFIEFIVLDPFFPPFDDNKIEKVREKMADAGDLLMSRVSNKDMGSKKKKDVKC